MAWMHEKYVDEIDIYFWYSISFSLLKLSDKWNKVNKIKNKN